MPRLEFVCPSCGGTVLIRIDKVYEYTAIDSIDFEHKALISSEVLDADVIETVSYECNTCGWAIPHSLEDDVVRWLEQHSMFEGADYETEEEYIKRTEAEIDRVVSKRMEAKDSGWREISEFLNDKYNIFVGEERPVEAEIVRQLAEEFFDYHGEFFVLSYAEAKKRGKLRKKLLYRKFDRIS